MKRLVLFVFVLSFYITVLSENNVFSRWSFTPEYGYNYFDGDVNKSMLNLVPPSIQNITYGANIEYAMTPIWGLALDYYYLPLRAQNTNPIPLYINTNLHTSALNLTLNLSRCIFPQTNSKFYVNASLGLGMSAYTYNLTNPDGTAVLPTTLFTDGKPVVLSDTSNNPLKSDYAGSVPVTLSIEYNFSKPVSIGLKFQYRFNTKDNLEGVTQLNSEGVTKDNVAAGTLFLRYKFNAIKKSHLRNIKFDVYDPDEALLLVKDLETKFNKLEGRVDTIGAKVDSLMPRVARLESLLSTDGPDSDGDGVPDARDKDMNTPANTPVDFWGKPLKLYGYSPTGDQNATGSSTNPNDATGGISTGARRAINVPEDVPAVYFDFDQIDLDDLSLITISKIAAKMKIDPTLFVEVRGYCDYLGNNPYNNLLSQRRADRVKTELVKVWGVPFDHVISNGKGKVIEPRMRYRPNRRCDFFFGRL